MPTELEGHLDRVTEDRIEGWARDAAKPDHPVTLRILDNGVQIGEVMADRHRGDLEITGSGTGHHSFQFSIPGGLSTRVRHVIQVQRSSDWRELPNSPLTLEATETTPIEEPAPVGVIRADDLMGNLDEATRELIEGWAGENDTDSGPVALSILDNGVEIARALANRYRSDLEDAGIGGGRRAFSIHLPAGLSPTIRHVIQVKRARDGADIPGSPLVIEPATAFDSALQRTLANTIAALENDEDHQRAASFLTGQLDRLLASRAKVDGRLSQRLAYRQFRRRWGPAADSAPDAPSQVLRALVVDLRIPAIDRDAGSHALLSHMGALRALDYEVSFVASEEMRYADEAIAGLTEAGIVCHGWPFYSSVEDVLRGQANCFDVIYLHRPEIASRYLMLARQHNSRARILYSVADLHHLRLARQAKVEDRPELMGASHRMRLLECTAAWLSDAVITHSTDEAAMLRQAVPTAHVNVVPWSVPLHKTSTPFDKRQGVAFVGGYGHSPNVDAACWLVEAVMPLVWETDPDIPCLLAGSDMPNTVQRLEQPGIVIVGHVANLVDDLFDKVRLTVAPLRYGAGVKGKVLESFASGVPCAMSEIAAEGLPLGEDLQNLVGKDAAALAALIRRLHGNHKANRAAATAGREMIGKYFTQDATLAAMKGAIEGRRQV